MCGIKLKLSLFLLLIMSVAGCRSVPFKGIDYVRLDNLNPDTLLEEFKSKLAQKSETVSSIVFEYKWQSFSALGFTQLDLAQETFQVSCMNPVGIKLFELTGDQNEIKSIFVLNELLQRGDLPRAVGEDIRRIYFKFTPSAEAKAKKEKYRIVFSQPSGAGKLVYVFAGGRQWLVEKHYFEKKRKLWSVFYYDYLTFGDQLYPAALIFKHHRFGYNLIIRLKEVR